MTIDPTLFAWLCGGFTGFMIGVFFGIWATASERQITSDHEHVLNDD